MTEAFIHYLWKYRLLNPQLQLTNSEPLTIIKTGDHNTGGGPDFLNAVIRAGNTVWAGNVEIHVNASDWYRHNHQEDPAYSNVILHVVLVNDTAVSDACGKPLMTLDITGNYDHTLSGRYDELISNRHEIACGGMITDADPFHFTSWAPSLAVERLMRKTDQFLKSWEECGRDWDECFYRQLARAFGFRINSDAFSSLAASVPYRIVRKHNDSFFVLESLFYGQASLISGNEEYPMLLSKEYDYLRRKYELMPLQPGIFRFLRLRPSNFPTIRISQLCDLLVKKADILQMITGTITLEEIRLLLDSAASSYWNDHYTFGKLSPPGIKKTGEDSIRLLVLNLIIPFIFFYGEMKKKPEMREKALELLEEEHGEMNSIVRFWKSSGLPVENALHTQALIQLRETYCDQKRCLECRIGKELLK